jgi:hypothetical protein
MRSLDEIIKTNKEVLAKGVDVSLGGNEKGKVSAKSGTNNSKDK